MLVILAEWVLEFVGMLIYFLGPCRLILVTENPTFHVLRFDYEYAIDRNNDMVNLGGPIFCRQRDVLDKVVFVLVEHQFRRHIYNKLTDHALKPRGFQHSNQDHKWDQKPKHAHHLIYCR